MFGLMTIKKHEAVAEANKGLLRDLLAERDKFKTAITDLAAARDEIEALRPDAKKHRDKAERNAERKRNLRAAAKAA